MHNSRCLFVLVFDIFGDKSILLILQWKPPRKVSMDHLKKMQTLEGIVNTWPPVQVLTVLFAKKLL